MSSRRPRARQGLAAGLLLLSCGAAGCLIPARGTPVFVDSRIGEFWSGKGMLLEVSPDQKNCRVKVRDRALIVRDRWVSCRYVHPR